MNYSPVGSSAGIAAISAREVDFGASDVPMNASELAAAKGGTDSTQAPDALGAEGVAYNLDLPAGTRLHLTGPVLARIFLGQMTRWDDLAITALNPGISLPDASIAVVHRSDGSGTTYIFSNYLSSVSPTWAAKVGTSKTLSWPAGKAPKATAGDLHGVPHPVLHRLRRAGIFPGPGPAVRRHPQPGLPTTSSSSTQTIAAAAAQTRPKTPHHAHRLFHRQPARRQQLPHHRIHLGADLHPPARPGPRAATGQHARLAHPHRPGLRRREPLRPRPSQVRQLAQTRLQQVTGPNGYTSWANGGVCARSRRPVLAGAEPAECLGA